MSDGDVFCRVAAKGWRGVAAAMRDRAHPVITGSRIEDALARELRYMGGLTSPEIRYQLRVEESSEPPTAEQVVGVFEYLLNHRVADRVMPKLIGVQYNGMHDARRYLDECIDHARLPELARSACTHPDGRGLRRSPRPRRSQVDLMNDEAPLGGNA